ncbi:MAG: D-alanyl-D-alanine carboxypeptidase [Saonia sp.]
MLKITTVFFVLFLLISCTSTKYAVLEKRIDTNFKTDFYNNHFVGFLLIDPETKDTLYNTNGQKYFTPASNTKIFTLYTAIKLLPENIPALKYRIQNDTLFMEGTGDPSFLHPYFRDSTAIRFLKDFENIAWRGHHFHDEKFGPGWAWEDYQYYYAPERSGLPMYGNVVTLYKNDSIHVIPKYFKDQLISVAHIVHREIDRNIFYFDPLRKDTLEIPFITDSTLTRKLLTNLLQKKVTLTDKMPDGEKKVLYGIPSDSIYKRMMRESDNFLAEQLLVVASSTLSDTLSGKKARDYMLHNFLNDLRQQPRWVDGSGLSRYNLCTPESIVQLLHKLYKEVPKERLFTFFPEWGNTGSIAPNSEDTAYIYAKSGSLSNNYCLSGYLLTKSGKTLIFSFMNNHFNKSGTAMKKEIEIILNQIRNTY